MLDVDDILCYEQIMANILNKDKQIAVISGLAEGASMRALTRMTGVHRDTICRLAVRVGQGCARVMDEKMRNLDCHYLQPCSRELKETFGLWAI